MNTFFSETIFRFSIRYLSFNHYNLDLYKFLWIESKLPNFISPARTCHRKVEVVDCVYLLLRQDEFRYDIHQCCATVLDSEEGPSCFV